MEIKVSRKFSVETKLKEKLKGCLEVSKDIKEVLDCAKES